MGEAVRMTAGQASAAREIYADCLRRGCPPAAAARLVSAAVARRVRRRVGLGEELPASAFEPKLAPEKNILQLAAEHETVAKIRATVSPWLWVLSLTSFAMAVVNRKQIAAMFGNWKRRQEKKG